jgi:hypothetical protein
VLIACAGDSREFLSLDLERQVLAAGMRFWYEHIHPFTWRRMIEWERHMGQKLPTEPICFVDASDFLLLGTASELTALSTQQDILFHSDAHCWPEPHKADEYPPSPTRYRYVNGTGPLARYAGHVADLIDYGMARFPIRGNESSIFADNDQRFWTDIYLHRHRLPIDLAIDTHCKLSISLNSIGDAANAHVVGKRLLTMPMGTMPIFAHFNGASKHRFATEAEVLRRC